MEGEIKHLTRSTFLWVISSLSYCYLLSSRLPKGKYRPIFYLFTVLPLSHSHAITSISTTFLISWLANFKLLLFAFNKGPLSMGPKKSLPLFIAVASLPIVIKEKSNHPSHHTHRIFHSLKNLSHKLVFQVLLLNLFISLWGEYKEFIHPKTMPILLVCVLYLVVEIIISSTHVLVRALSGLELEPPSDEPYLSTSIQNLWGQRWNLPASHILRITVFEPTQRVAKSSGLAKNQSTYIAYIATFLVSGFMHELMLYNITQQATTWEVTLYFVLHGTCIVLELITKRVLNDKFQLPIVVSRVLTITFVLGTGSWLLIPPFSSHALDVRFIEEIASVLEFLKGILQLIKVH